jgi:putative phage-type endonuclease
MPQLYDHPRHGQIIVTDHVKFLIEKDLKEWCPQREPEWYTKRMNHLTASAIAALCGANKYKKRSEVIRAKTGHPDGFKGNEATRHGEKHEMPAIEKYEKMTGEKVIEFGLLKSLNENEYFLAGSPDGITASGKLIEVKCPYYRTPQDFVPDMYKYQIQTLMQILHLESCDFIQYVPEAMWVEEIFIVTLEKRDRHFWANHFPTLERCWEEIVETRKKQEENGGVTDEEEDEEDEEEGYNPCKGKVVVIPDKTDITPEGLISLQQSSEYFTDQPDWSLMKNFFDNMTAKH